MLIEERMTTKKILAKLDGVPLGRMYHASFRALMRLQIYFTGYTNEAILNFGKDARAILLKHADKETGVMDGNGGFTAQTDLLKAWGKVMDEWQTQFQRARDEAGSIPFGVLAVSHERLIRPLTVDNPSPSPSPNDEGQERHSERGAINEAIVDGVFNPQLKILLNVASEYLYGDGLTLSNRVWELENGGRDAINQVIIKGITDGTSAWEMAKELEALLGANEDCPRWTKSRLYNMSVEDRSTSTTGLLNGNACDGSGVSYKALRLARTEIQKIHSLATDRIMAMQPWIEKEQCHLSAAHKEHDECDEVIANGENGEGIYDKGTIEYPLHPNCFCFKTAVLMDEKEFTSQLNGWLKGESWPEMDEYAEMIGNDVNVDLSAQTLNLAVWLFADSLEEWIQ